LLSKGIKDPDKYETPSIAFLADNDGLKKHQSMEEKRQSAHVQRTARVNVLCGGMERQDSRKNHYTKFRKRKNI